MTALPCQTSCAEQCVAKEHPQQEISHISISPLPDQLCRTVCGKRTPTAGNISYFDISPARPAVQNSVWQKNTHSRKYLIFRYLPCQTSCAEQCVAKEHPQQEISHISISPLPDQLCRTVCGKRTPTAGNISYIYICLIQWLEISHNNVEMFVLHKCNVCFLFVNKTEKL